MPIIQGWYTLLPWNYTNEYEFGYTSSSDPRPLVILESWPGMPCYPTCWYFGRGNIIFCKQAVTNLELCFWVFLLLDSNHYYSGNLAGTELIIFCGNVVDSVGKFISGIGPVRIVAFLETSGYDDFIISVKEWVETDTFFVGMIEPKT